MSRYILTQEQLDRLQEEIQQLNHFYEMKQERIKNLEINKVRVSSSETADLLKTISKLQEEIKNLKEKNKHLTAVVDARKADISKINQLEALLEEERKLREYSEAFAKQVELKCAEESQIRELTTELCRLQKDEIEIDNKRILKLQNRLKEITNKIQNNEKYEENKQKVATNSKKRNKENLEKIDFRDTVNKIQDQLLDLQDNLNKRSFNAKEDRKYKSELEKWLQEIKLLSEDLADTEYLKNDLSYLKAEIENRRRNISYNK